MSEKDFCYDCSSPNIWCICGLDKSSITSFTSRFESFVKDLRKEKIKFRRNVYSCCRGCVTEELLGMKSPTQPVIWHFGGQGNSLDFAGNGVYYRNTWDYANEIYFNHDNISDEIRNNVIDLLNKYDFVWTWNPGETIIIDVKKSIDQYFTKLNIGQMRFENAIMKNEVYV